MRYVTVKEEGVRVRTLALCKREAIRHVQFDKLDVLPDRMSGYFDKRWDHHLAAGSDGDPREFAFVDCARKWGVKDEADVRRLRYLLGLPKDAVRNIVTWDRQTDEREWNSVQVALEKHMALPADAVQIGRAYTAAGRIAAGIQAEEALGGCGDIERWEQSIEEAVATDSLSEEAEVDHQMPEDGLPWPMRLPESLEPGQGYIEEPKVGHYINTMKTYSEEWQTGDPRQAVIQAQWLHALYYDFIEAMETHKRVNEGKTHWRQWLNRTLDEECGQPFMREVRKAWADDRYNFELYQMMDLHLSLPNDHFESSEVSYVMWAEEFDRQIAAHTAKEAANFLSPLPPAYRSVEFWNAYMRAFLNGHSKDRALLEGVYAYASSRGFEGTLENFFALDNTRFMAPSKDGKLFRSGKLFSQRVKKCLWKSSPAAQKAYLAWLGATQPNRVDAKTRNWALALKRKWLAQQAQAQQPAAVS